MLLKRSWASLGIVAIGKSSEISGALCTSTESNRSRRAILTRVPGRSVEPTEPESPDDATSGATHADTPRAMGTEDTAADVTARPRSTTAPPRHESTTHILAGKPAITAASAFPATTEALDQAELPR